MAKITYASLKLKQDKKVEKITYNDKEIEVIQYLPVEDKIDLINITLQKAFDDNIYNQVKLDMYFHLHLVYLYSNITYTEKQREDEYKLYDSLKESGLMEEIIKLIPEKEYNDLLFFLESVVSDRLEYGNSAAGILKSFISDMPAQAEAMQEILNNWDPNKFQEVINFATAANGGRALQ